MSALVAAMVFVPSDQIDPVLFEALGLDLGAADVVQAKSPVSFRAGYARVADRMIVADGTGPASSRLAALPFVRRPRPLFPFEQEATPSIR